MGPLTHPNYVFFQSKTTTKNIPNLEVGNMKDQAHLISVS
jgi:hypothetical protein